MFLCYGRSVATSRPKGRRYVPLRVSEAGYERLRARAAVETEGNVSELMRRMLKYAEANMPKGWQ